MERIGIAASKIAKGNLFLYNFTVVFLSFLFSLFIFFIAGSAVVLALILISRIATGIIPDSFEQGWTTVTRVCMTTLTLAVLVFNLMAISRNIKLTKNDSQNIS